MTGRVLVAEDEEILRRNLIEFLRAAGYEVVGAADGVAALELAREEDFDVVVTDIRMPRMDGIELLRKIVAERPETKVLVTTAYASVDTAIEALRFGAYDYLLKPIAFEDLEQKIKNLVSYAALRDEVHRLRRDLSQRLGFEGLLGRSEPISRVFELVSKVAPTPSVVLVTGESGTGKELVARAVHARSSVSEREFLAVNVAAIPSELIEAQLFGHEKGSFTGADRRREGILRGVHGGSVFLDEIGELPIGAQAKLLRAVESGELLPVGADRPVRAEFRLIAATNQDLEAAVADGRFRGDLYYRLNVFQIPVPALRDRRDDVPLLVAHFVERHSRTTGRRAPVVSNDAMRLLLGYHWPGNVRELSNVVERAVILAAEGRIEPTDLPTQLAGASTATPLELRDAIAQFERRHIAWVLETTGGNRDRAAALLGVDPATLYRRLAKHGLNR